MTDAVVDGSEDQLKSYVSAFDAVSKSIIPSDHTRLSSVPDHLYHYTDSSGLIGILNTHTIWATDSRFLNDRTELIYAEELAKEIVQEKLSNPSHKYSTELFSGCLQEIGNYGGTNSFLFCLSADPDSLSQWRGYAKDGRGFSIGFDGKELCKSATGGISNYGIRRVEYDLDVQKKTISLLIDQIDKKLEEIGEEAAITPAISNFSWSIFLLSYFYKHRSFQDEKEWRLVSVMYSNEVGNSSNSILTRSRQDELVPYAIFKPRSGPMAASDRLMLSKIGIGPGFSHANQGVAARQLIAASGYDVDIYFADTPYRRL